MLLSIVIPTYNRADTLERLLLHLEHQTDQEFQVVVAMDGGTDHTQRMLENIDVGYDLKWLDTKFSGYGLAMARNRGILSASGELVAIIDDDSFPVPHYVEALKKSARPDTITGGPRMPADASETRQLWKMRELAKLPPCEPLTIEELRRDFPKAVATECNICMYRESIIDMGMFSERLRIYGFIGQEFFERAKHFGIRYQYDPAAETIHDRQHEGKEGLNDARKKREIMVATALRSSFMTQKQFDLQKRWAACSSAQGGIPCALPPFPKSAVVLFPFRFMRNRLGDLRRKIRDRSK